MNAESVKKAVSAVSHIIEENKEYLIQLDAQNGDGDLGISMDNGFRGAESFVVHSEISDVGMLLNKMADHFNEAAPSSLGTIITFGLKGMARRLKGKEEFSAADLADAFLEGVSNITLKAKSKPGEKTILDAVYPAAKTLAEHADEPLGQAFRAAAEAAATGSERTREMKAVWGRAAYYSDESFGVLDGGAVVGRLIFEAFVTLIEC